MKRLPYAARRDVVALPDLPLLKSEGTNPNITPLHRKLPFVFDAVNLQTDKSFWMRFVDVLADQVFHQVSVYPRLHTRALGDDT